MISTERLSSIQEQRLLKSHGFEQWPSDEELLRYIFSVEDKIDFLAQNCGFQFERDVRGRLRYRSTEVG